MKHILIDYENIQPKSFNDIETNECHVWLFLGVNQQKSLPLDLVETLLRFDNRNVHIIRMQHAGKNALDFYLSFYLGKISEIDSQADVCILARDSGYDVLVDHLNSVYDGMNIMRSTNANQLSLTYDFDENIESDIEEIQIVSQNILCDSGSNVVVENENALVQSLEERIPKVVIHDCYVLVFDSMLNREVFLPSYKSNLLSAIKKYALAKALVKFDDAEQDYIVEKVFDKFIKSGLIKLDGKSEKLSYKVDSQGILDLVTEQVLLSRAKTIAGLKNVVKQKLTSYRQENDEQQVNLVITWLKNQEFIKQNNETICYPTLEDKKTPSNKVSNDDSDISKPSATVYQRAITAIKSRPLKSRPSKKSSLINYLKSHLRNEDPRVVDNLIKQMISNKIILISNTNKLSYNI
ncbi:MULTISPECIES: PIN domain-containing protein [unclassified Psychrobacter]|uniref:PIN domain-containing protein n=1 Tax=unclassified Psychrobacter TaxID=196806 RepID=UPI003FCFF35B